MSALAKQADSHKVRFAVPAGGKSFQMSVSSGTTVIVR